MVVDWSGVPMNAYDAPLGHVRLTPAVEYGRPFFVAASSILTVEEAPLGTIVGLPLGRLTVRENIREVFRRKAEANTVGATEVVEKPDRVRKKA